MQLTKPFFVLSLCVALWPTALQADSEPYRPDCETFTVVVLPDTQVYAQKYPKVFHDQTKWIVENVDLFKIRFVSHVGDVIQDNTKDASTQWNTASKAMARLDDAVPWGTTIGNHDLDTPNNPACKSSAYFKHFPPKRFDDVVDASPNGLSVAQTFTAGGRKYLFLHLEMDTPDESIAWAEKVLKKHPGMPTLVTTHIYLDRAGERREPKNYCRKEGGNCPEALWQKFISKNPQIFIVLCGHWCVESTLYPKNDAGLKVIEMEMDYQNQPQGGNGWLRLLVFEPQKNQIRVQTYSPTLKRYKTDRESEFVIPFDFTKRFSSAFAGQ